MDLKVEKSPGVWVVQDEKWEYRYNMPETTDEIPNVTELNQNNFESELKSTNRLIFVECYAVWCKVCEMVLPVIKEVMKECKKGVKYCRLNVEEAPRLVETNGIKAIPTIMLITDCKIVERIVGLKKKDEYVAQIRKYLDEVVISDLPNNKKRCIDFQDTWKD